ncbi:MAG TPA: hypothetical protein VF046_14080 [Gemmatimonadales bacterium]
MTGLQITALSAALAVGAVAPLAAQDTSNARTSPDTSAYQGAAGVDTSAQGKPDSMWGYKVDTNAAQNPPGYRGMERPSNVLPDSGIPQDTEHVKGRVTGVYSDSSWNDSTGAEQNQDTSGAAAQGNAPDTTKVGDTSTRKPHKASQRMHPGSDTASKAGVTGAADSAGQSGMSDTSGMSGRHQNSDTSSSTSQQSTSDTSQ